MLYIYMDEAGISECEPVSVVCAVIIDDRGQSKNMLADIERIRNEHVPAALRHDFIFHAADIHNGKKPFLRESFPPAIRNQIIAEVAATHIVHTAPLCVGYQRRTTALDLFRKRKHQVEADHFYAFSYCLGVADNFLVKHGHGARAQIICENVGKVRRALEAAPECLRDPTFPAFPGMEGLYPLKNIDGHVRFGSKQDEPLLQIADACAFSVRRYASGKPDGVTLFEATMGLGTTRLKLTPVSALAAHLVLGLA